MKKTYFLTILLAYLGAIAPVQAQEVVNPNCNISKERSLAQLTQEATLVVEGRVETARCFFNPNGRIFTATLVTVFKVFKGSMQGDLVEIITPGGTVGEQSEVHDDNPAVLPLNSGGTGLFFGVPTAQGGAGSGLSNFQVLDVVGEYEGFFRYSGEAPEPGTAYSTCRRYRNVPTTLYAPIQQATGISYTELNPFNINEFTLDYSYGRSAKTAPAPSAQRSTIGAPSKQKKSLSTGQAGASPSALSPQSTPVISNVSPNSITAGTFDDITITGSGFSSPGNPTDKPTVLFTNVQRLVGGNQYVPAPEENILPGWTDTRLVVRVPSNFTRTILGTTYSGVAGTGPILVQQFNGGTSTPSSTLVIPRAEHNFDSPQLTGPSQAYRQVRLTGRNAGGYRFRYGPVVYNMPEAVRGIQYGLQQWRCSTNVNYGDDISTAVAFNPNAALDLMCNIEMVNFSGPLQPLMRTVRNEAICSQNSNNANYAYTSAIDVLINNTQNWNYDYNQSPLPEQYDFASTILHELGHGVALEHVADATKMMYPVLNRAQVRRLFSAEPELAGAAAVLGRSTAAYTCSQGGTYFPMQPLTSATCQGALPASVDPPYYTVNTCTFLPTAVTLRASGGNSYVWVSKDHFNNTNPTTSTVTASTSPNTTIGVYTTLNGLGATALIPYYPEENVHCPPAEETFYSRTSAYPNPSADDFAIDYQPAAGTRDVEFFLHNNQGTVLRTFRFPGNSQRRTFRIQGLGTGLYHLRVVENGRPRSVLRLQVQ